MGIMRILYLMVIDVKCLQIYMLNNKPLSENSWFEERLN